MAAGRLDVLLGLDAAEFTKGLTKAELDAKKFQQNLAKIGSQVGVALGAGLAAAATGAALLTKSAIDAADHLNDLSKATGVAVETLGGIGFAAGQAGSDLDGVAQAFGKLNLKIAEAARGEKEAADAFKKMGVEIRNAAGQVKTADEIFRDVATAFAAYPEGPEKAALANAIFGKSYQALLPLLADGGQALQENIEYYQRFNGTTTETARAADQFNDTLGKINLVTGQLGRNLATELLPPLQAVADEMLRFAEESGTFDFIAKAARVAFETIAVLGANVIFVFQGLGRELGAYFARLQALVTLDLSGFKAISEALAEDNRRAEKELDRIEKRILGLAAGPSLASRIGTANPDRQLERITRGPTAAPSLAGPSRPASASRVKEEIDETTKAYERYVEELTRGLEKEQEIGEVQRLTYALQQGALSKLTEDRRAALLFYAEQLDAQEKFNKTVAENARLENAASAARQARTDRLNELTGATQAKRDLEDLILLQEELNLRGDEFLDEFIAATNKIAGFDKEVEKLNDTANELGLTFTSALEDAIVDFTDLRDIVKGLEKDLVRIGTRKLVTEPLADWFTGFIKGLGGSGGGGFGSILGAIFGGGKDLSGPWGTSYASGTDFVPRDMLAMIHRGERIVTAEDNRRGSFGNTTFAFNISGPVTRDTLNQVQAAAARGQSLASRRNS
jgi:hypothetical protein